VPAGKAVASLAGGSTSGPNLQFMIDLVDDDRHELLPELPICNLWLSHRMSLLPGAQRSQGKKPGRPKVIPNALCGAAKLG